MEITEVRIKLMEESEDRLRAFCSITFDHSFVVRDLKIIEGANGPFVAMPSRKMSARCGRCGSKNHLRSHYCNQCGSRLRGPQDLKDVEGGPNKLYADIAHPINQACRDLIQQAVVREYSLELERAKQPGYVSRYDEEYIDTTAAVHASSAPLPSAPLPSAPLPSAPLPSAPLPSAPLPSGTVPSGTVPSGPVPSGPVPSAPASASPTTTIEGVPVNRPHFLDPKPTKTPATASAPKEPKKFGDGVFE